MWCSLSLSTSHSSLLPSFSLFLSLSLARSLSLSINLPPIARSPVFSAMFEHSMEESIKVCKVGQLNSSIFGGGEGGMD